MSRIRISKTGVEVDKRFGQHSQQTHPVQKTLAMPGRKEQTRRFASLRRKRACQPGPFSWVPGQPPPQPLAGGPQFLGTVPSPNLSKSWETCSSISLHPKPHTSLPGHESKDEPGNDGLCGAWDDVEIWKPLSRIPGRRQQGDRLNLQMDGQWPGACIKGGL